MYKRLTLGILSLSLMFSLTGCIKNDFSVQVNHDGTAEVAVDLMLAKDFMSQVGMDQNAMLEQAMEANIGNMRLDTKTVITPEGEYSGVHFSQTCTTQEDILAALNNTTGAKSIIDNSMGAATLPSDEPVATTLPSPPPEPLIDKCEIVMDVGLFTTTYTANINLFPIWATDVQDSQATSMYDIATIVKSYFILTMPGELTSKDSIYATDDGIKVDLVSLTEVTPLTVTSRDTNMASVMILAGAIALAVIGICIVLLIKKRHRKTSSITEGISVEPSEDQTTTE